MLSELILLDYKAVAQAGKLLPDVANWLQTNPAPHIRLFWFEPRVGLRFWMENNRFGNPGGLPTEPLVMREYNAVAHQLGQDPLIAPLVGFRYRSEKTNEYAPAPVGRGNQMAWNEGYMLPGGRMFEEAIKATFKNKYPDPYNLHTIIISNDPEVLKAACRATIPFIWADVYFRRLPTPAPAVAEYRAKREAQEVALGMRE